MAKLLRFAVVVVILMAVMSIGDPSYTVTILHPPSGFDNSYAVGVSGSQQLGYADGMATEYFTGAIGVCI